jgi:hypothetical protein
MDWIDLAQDRDQWRALVNTVMHLWLPHNFGKCLSSLASGCFLRRALCSVEQLVRGCWICTRKTARG